MKVTDEMIIALAKKSGEEGYDLRTLARLRQDEPTLGDYLALALQGFSDQARPRALMLALHFFSLLGD